MEKVIAIANQKGGVAKTTTCLSLGACLAEVGKRVLLIDLDPQASLTLALGLKPHQVRRTIELPLFGQASLVSVSCESSLPQVDLIPANLDLGIVDKVLHAHKGCEFYLKHALAGLAQNLYDFVLIDCPPSFGPFTLNALVAADLLIIPTQCEYFAARSLDQALHLIKVVRGNANPSLSYRVLITMYDRRNKICRTMRELMQQRLGASLFSTVIEVDTKLRESPIFGQAITQFAPHTRGAHQYRELAAELLYPHGLELPAMRSISAMPAEMPVAEWPVAVPA